LSTAPIALFTFNRPEHTRRTVEALLCNELASDSCLYVFSDGPARPEDKREIDAVRQYAAGIRGFRAVEILPQSQNQGLARSIVQGVTQMCQRFARVIVLEDDLITSPYFLRFMNDGLVKYENEPRVISIHGYVYPLRDSLPETFFLKGADCWGWATWRRGWDLFESDGRFLLSELKRRDLDDEFDFGGNADYTALLARQVNGQLDSWAPRWYASAFLDNKLTLYPGRSLVQNIGLDGTGRHCGFAPHLEHAQLADTPVHINSIPIEESQIARRAFTTYFRNSRPSLISRVRRKLLAPFHYDEHNRAVTGRRNRDNE
jgi:hypothetical protein